MAAAKRFCGKGHDKQATGRFPDGTCKACRAARYEADKVGRRQRERARAMSGVPDVVGKECEICLQPFLYTPHADHDHQTGQFRGWLCARCNGGLGHIERPGWLASAAAYLARSAQREQSPADVRLADTKALRDRES